MNFWSWARWPARLRRQGEANPLTLTGEDPFAAVVQIAEALSGLRSDLRITRSEAAERLAELEMSARRCYREATRHYLRGLRLESAQTLSAWGRTVESCLMQLAHAHQALVVPWRETRSAPGLPPEQVPAVLARGMRVCAAVLKWSYLCQADEPVGVWGDLCRLYALAEGRACTRSPVALMPGLEPRSSIEREFLEACMLHVARPGQLRPEQVEIAERVTHFCAPGFALSGAGDPRFAHLIDIEGGDPPLGREAGVSAGPALRSFGMDGGERLLRALLRLVQSDRIPPRGFGAEVEKDLVLRTLEHLQSCWGSGAAPQARTEARAAAPLAQMTSGMSAA
jgi:hypothetical protein